MAELQEESQHSLMTRHDGGGASCLSPLLGARSDLSHRNDDVRLASILYLPSVEDSDRVTSPAHRRRSQILKA